MKKFLLWRKMTWVILLAGALGVAWVIASALSLPIIALSLGVVGLLWVLWYLTQPLHRQGRGLTMRRHQSSTIPFKRVESLVKARVVDPNVR
jgi:membrane protein implicated in regulation of membrane protease activity